MIYKGGIKISSLTAAATLFSTAAIEIWLSFLGSWHGLEVNWHKSDYDDSRIRGQGG
jgi:hypothetical protein